MAEPKPARPPGGAIRVALSGTYNNLPWVNRFWLHGVYSSTPTAAQLLTLSNAFSALYRTRFLPQVSSAATLHTQRSVLYVDADTEVAVDGSDTGSGSLNGTGNQPQVSPLINWSIASTYRGGHPRTYLPPADSAHIGSDGALVGSYVTALTTAALGLISDVNALSSAGFTSVALGTFRFFRNHSAVNPPVFEPFISGSAHPRAATQRRRART